MFEIQSYLLRGPESWLLRDLKNYFRELWS